MSRTNGSQASMTRRQMLKVASISLVSVAVPLLAACQEKIVEKVVTQVVEKPVEKVVTQVVEKEKVVEKQVTQVVTQVVTKEVEKIVTPTAVPKPVVGARKAGGTLNVWQPNGWPEQSWPHISNWESGWAISPQADRLFWVKADGTLDPLLGESVTPSADGLKWTIKMRKGAKWSDGKPITAQDYVFSVHVQYSPEKKPLSELRAGFSIIGIKDYANGKANTIEGLKAVDDTTVEYTLTEPDATMANLWLGGQMVLPQHMLKDIPIADLGTSKYWIDKPVASGPYKFVKYVTDQYIEYERNDLYWDNKPRPDKLFLRISSPEVAIVSLQKGELDLVNPLQLTEVARLKADPKVEIVEAKNNAQFYGLERNFYTKNGVWRNPKAIQGMLHAIDRQAYVNTILQGYGAVRHSFYDGSAYACASMTKYDYNPDKAKQLLEEAGVPKDKPISFMSWLGIKARLDYLPIAQEYLRKLGYKVEVDLIDNSLITDYIEGKGPRGKDWDFHVLLFGPGVDPGTGESFIDPQSNSNWSRRSWPVAPGADGKKAGVEWVFENAKMSELYKKGRLESDPAKRKAIYQELDCLYNQTLPFVPTASPSFVMAKTTRIQGLDWQNNAGLGQWTLMYRPGDWWIAF